MELEHYRSQRLATKRPLNRSAIARQNPVSVVGGGATIGGGGTGAGVSPSPSPSGEFSSQRFFFNYYPWYGYGYNPWWGYNYGYPYGGWNWGWPMGYGFRSPVYWPQFPQSYPYWPGPYAYAPRYPVVAVA